MARHDLPNGTYEVPAECHSDDHGASATFDATPWLKKATVKELANLVSCGFGYYYGSDGLPFLGLAVPAGHLAIWAEGWDRNVKDMFDYMERHRGLGFDCHVEQDKALAWLKAHRPDFIKALPTLMGMNWRIDELITEVAKGNQP